MSKRTFSDRVSPYFREVLSRPGHYDRLCGHVIHVYRRRGKFFASVYPGGDYQGGVSVIGEYRSQDAALLAAELMLQMRADGTRLTTWRDVEESRKLRRAQEKAALTHDAPRHPPAGTSLPPGRPGSPPTGSAAPLEHLRP